MKSILGRCGFLMLLATFASVGQAATVTKTFSTLLTFTGVGTDAQALDGQIVKVRVQFTDGGTIAGTQVFLTGVNPNPLVGTIGASVAGTPWRVENATGPLGTDRLRIGYTGNFYNVGSQSLSLTLNSPSSTVVAANSTNTADLTSLISSVLSTPLNGTVNLLQLFDAGNAGPTSSYSGTIVGVPEPASMALLGMVVAGGAAIQRRRNRRAVAA